MGHALGITSGEAQSLLTKFGPNEITYKNKRGPISIFFSQFHSFLVGILFIAAFLSLLLSDVVDSIFIFAIILLNGLLGFLQEYRAEKALAALRRLAVAKAIVIRDGVEQEILSTQIVPGDLIAIKEGDKIPADAMLVAAVHLEVNEASLTGESLPVFKRPNEKEHNTVFLGTTVIRGRGKAIVTATGVRRSVRDSMGLRSERRSRKQFAHESLDAVAGGAESLPLLVVAAGNLGRVGQMPGQALAARRQCGAFGVGFGAKSDHVIGVGRHLGQ